jgi:hypothetical protein
MAADLRAWNRDSTDHCFGQRSSGAITLPHSHGHDHANHHTNPEPERKPDTDTFDHPEPEHDAESEHYPLTEHDAQSISHADAQCHAHHQSLGHTHANAEWRNSPQYLDAGPRRNRSERAHRWIHPRQWDRIEECCR